MRIVVWLLTAPASVLPTTLPRREEESDSIRCVVCVSVSATRATRVDRKLAEPEPLRPPVPRRSEKSTKFKAHLAPRNPILAPLALHELRCAAFHHHLHQPLLALLALALRCRTNDSNWERANCEAPSCEREARRTRCPSAHWREWCSNAFRCLRWRKAGCDK